MILHEYHDATLVHCKLDWARGTCEFELRLCAREPTVATLQFDGVIEFRWNRHLAWGKSVSVNELRDFRSDEGASVEIEMQSGDVIKVSATDWRASTQKESKEHPDDIL